MADPIVLASKSTIRSDLLRNAGVIFQMETARIDEDTIKRSLVSQDATARDIADYLAEAKSAKVSSRHPEALTIGCDQVLAFRDQLFSKPQSQQEALQQLQQLSGNTHQLLSAAVIYQEGKPLWRHVGVVRLHMRDCSAAYLEGYVDRNWDDIQHCVGAYQIEAEGLRLFHKIDGDYFHVLGLPLLELLSYLTLTGALDG